MNIFSQKHNIVFSNAQSELRQRVREKENVSNATLEMDSTARRVHGEQEGVEKMYEIVQRDNAGDFVLENGEADTVKEFVKEVFSYFGLDGLKYVKIDQRCFQQTEVESLIADISKIRRTFNLQPKNNFHDLVKISVDTEIGKIKLEPVGEGDALLKDKLPNKWWQGD